MEEVEKLFKSSSEEIETLLMAKNVVGEPMVVDGYTSRPLLSRGFGFAFGAGDDKETKGKNREDEGSGGGGEVEPVTVIIISEDAVRVETI